MGGEFGEWGNQYSQSVLCDMDALKAELKRIFKKNPIPGQPTGKNGKPYKELFYSEMVVQVDDMANVTALTEMINDMGYNANSSAEWIQQELDSMNMIQAVLGAIGAVAMLVAAISITNTMMMSIYERTKEIGVMKVLGCDIQYSFPVLAGGRVYRVYRRRGRRRVQLSAQPGDQRAGGRERCDSKHGDLGSDLPDPAVAESARDRVRGRDRYDRGIYPVTPRDASEPARGDTK